MNVTQRTTLLFQFYQSSKKSCCHTAMLLLPSFCICTQKVHSVAINDNNDNKEHESTKTKGKPKKQKKTSLLLPPVSKHRLKTIRRISSIVVTSQELSFLVMNNDFLLTDLVSIPFSNTNRSTRHAYYNLLYPLKEFQSQIDLNVIERHVLPPKYNAINLHLKSVVMLLLGMFEEDPAHRRVTFACRKHIGSMFDLNIEKTQSRKCSKAVVTEIIQRQRWKETSVNIPEDILTERNDIIFYTERLMRKLNKQTLSPETADALIQAIGFWYFANKLA